MKKFMILLALLTMPFIMTTQALADQYSVYCANGKIEVDRRTLKEMLSARGTNVYVMVSYEHLSDANNFAKKMGGVGAKCPKK